MARYNFNYHASDESEIITIAFEDEAVNYERLLDYFITFSRALGFSESVIEEYIT